MVKGSPFLPRHIGIIMDGNRRFARAAGVDLEAGHDFGATKAREVLDWCLELGIRHVTLWGFSTENRGRKPEEVAHLHRIFGQQAKELLTDERIHANRVRVRVIGDIEDFPEEAKDALRAMEEATGDYDGMQVNVALGYGGREEIVAAVRNLLAEKAAAGEGPGRGRRRAERRGDRPAPLHRRIPRSRLRHPHLGRGAPVGVPAVAERLQRVLLLRRLLAGVPPARLPARRAQLPGARAPLRALDGAQR